jgi:hypothetical protein
MGSENAHGCSQMQRMALTLSEPYYKDGDKFIKHIVYVTADETWISFVNVETKEQSKQWMHTHSPDKLKRFEQTSACQKADGNCAVGGIHATRDYSNVRSLLRSTKKTA